jgi:hypothetical protein
MLLFKVNRISGCELISTIPILRFSKSRRNTSKINIDDIIVVIEVTVTV